MDLQIWMTSLSQEFKERKKYILQILLCKVCIDYNNRAVRALSLIFQWLKLITIIG